MCVNVLKCQWLFLTEQNKMRWKCAVKNLLRHSTSFSAQYICMNSADIYTEI